jgi:1-acyl-sn-glycerol-3-phosphate acyltransferase
MAKRPTDSAFIPANESRLFLLIFGWAVRRLFAWHFSKISIQQFYTPGPGSKTIYYLNHTSWWDGIIPLLLNQTRFKQNARAIMEDRQMRQYPFFSWIGAFSIHLKDPRGAVASLRYALDSMKRERASLFIFPEGRINMVSDTLPTFQDGLGWLVRQTSLNGIDVDIVPVSIHVHCCNSPKPELWIMIGRPFAPVQNPRNASSEDITMAAHDRLQRDLTALKKAAHAVN